MSSEEQTRPLKPIAITVVERSVEPGGDEVLIGLRPEGVPLAGYWEFPGGKVKPNESFESAALRECVEETGLTVEVIGEYPESKFEYEHACVHLRFFRCRLTADHKQQEAFEPFRWVAKADLASYRFPEANDTLIRSLATE